MKVVKIINGDEIITINGPNSCNKIQGNTIESVSSIDSLNFKIYPDNKGFNKLFEFITKVKCGDFEGRVISVVPRMDSSGEVYKTVICESYLGYLNDTFVYQSQLEAFNTRLNLINLLIYAHNQKSEYQFTRGSIAGAETSVTFLNDKGSTYKCLTSECVKGSNEALYYSIEKISDNNYRIDLTSNSVDASENAEINLGRNLKAIHITPDFTNFCTRLYPYGLDENGNEFYLKEGDSQAAAYVESEFLRNKYGLIERPKVFEDANNQDLLRYIAESYINSSPNIKVNVNLDAYDLSDLGLSNTKFERGHWYKVICPLIGFNENLQVRQVTRDINDEHVVLLKLSNIARRGDE